MIPLKLTFCVLIRCITTSQGCATKKNISAVSRKKLKVNTIKQYYGLFTHGMCSGHSLFRDGASFGY